MPGAQQGRVPFQVFVPLVKSQQQRKYGSIGVTILASGERRDLQQSVVEWRGLEQTVDCLNSPLKNSVRAH